ncbi:Uncharacterized protein MCB1EB_0452 [Mycoavidus cysteinexigens]|uniref:Uncharacterized protein n=1 Tax=Mycoavidus cysteinexigens TaxID=1553431 RepID=A0A2Z6ET66_9BURK|nr:DUF4224 domain-containing protein [Mycoavidus cysteinexigens]BBE08613.1 Uncharacterized protein MCB1EB_0452 [Mycoavidus cysteinexigens]GAM52684.1 hypothetical protein EBME_1147 [bacterium endosymbiont of Mortierella elongata FMR23-6]GLR01523.1 hypothetical protein GCM10007934_13350 [Mycoavidus cysteinexigens]
MSEVFLTEEQVDEFTGIKRGHTRRLCKKPTKLTKYQRQAEFLSEKGIAFFLNARDRPIVTRAFIEGRPEPIKPAAIWRPSVLI